MSAGANSSSTSTSQGLQQDFRGLGAFNYTRGAGLPSWALPLVIIGVVGVAIVWLLKK